MPHPRHRFRFGSALAALAVALVGLTTAALAHGAQVKITNDRTGQTYQPQYREVTVHKDGTVSFWGTTVSCGTIVYSDGFGNQYHGYAAIPIDPNDRSHGSFNAGDFGRVEGFDPVAFVATSSRVCGRRFPVERLSVTDGSGTVYYYDPASNSLASSLGGDVLFRSASGKIMFAKIADPALARVITAGGGNVISAGGGNVIAAGGGNVIAAGGGNVIAAGGGNVIAAGGGNLTIRPGALAGVIAAGGGNVIAAGGGNVIAAGGGNVIAAGGGNFHVMDTGGKPAVSGADSPSKLSCKDAPVYVPGHGDNHYYLSWPSSLNGGVFACLSDAAKRLGLQMGGVYTGSGPGASAPPVAVAPPQRYQSAPAATPSPSPVTSCDFSRGATSMLFVIERSNGAPCKFREADLASATMERTRDQWGNSISSLQVTLRDGTRAPSILASALTGGSYVDPQSGRPYRLGPSDLVTEIAYLASHAAAPKAAPAAPAAPVATTCDFSRGATAMLLVIDRSDGAPCKFRQADLASAAMTHATDRYGNNVYSLAVALRDGTKVPPLLASTLRGGSYVDPKSGRQYPLSPSDLVTQINYLARTPTAPPVHAVAPVAAPRTSPPAWQRPQPTSVRPTPPWQRPPTAAAFPSARPANCESGVPAADLVTVAYRGGTCTYDLTKLRVEASGATALTFLAAGRPATLTVSELVSITVNGHPHPIAPLPASVLASEIASWIARRG